MRQPSLWAPDPLPASGPRVIAPGAVWLRGYLPLERQRALVREAQGWLDGPAGGYVPTVRGGGRMHLRMCCLGRHWNPLTYTYEATRRDHDGLAVPPLPDAWRALAEAAAGEAGFTIAPDICLINHYGDDGRLGLHQDKDEGRGSVEAGVPVVSVSLGDTARFVWGGLTRNERAEAFFLESGDVFVFGGPSRLRFHGVTRILRGTGPETLGLDGRINLTFRQF